MVGTDIHTSIDDGLAVRRECSNRGRVILVRGQDNDLGGGGGGGARRSIIIILLLNAAAAINRK